MLMKLMGSIFIVASCSGFGFYIAKTYYFERSMLKQWIHALDFMQCQLQYHMNPLPELCREAAEQEGGKIGTLLHTLASELDCRLEPDVSRCMVIALEKTKDLPNSVREAALELGNNLGRFDSQGQVRQLEAVRNSSRHRLDKLEKDVDIRIRSYQTLGVCAGAALAILLI